MLARARTNPLPVPTPRARVTAGRHTSYSEITSGQPLTDFSLSVVTEHTLISNHFVIVARKSIITAKVNIYRVEVTELYWRDICHGSPMGFAIIIKEGE